MTFPCSHNGKKCKGFRRITPRFPLYFFRLPLHPATHPLRLELSARPSPCAGSQILRCPGKLAAWRKDPFSVSFPSDRMELNLETQRPERFAKHASAPP